MKLTVQQFWGINSSTYTVLHLNNMSHRVLNGMLNLTRAYDRNYDHDMGIVRNYDFKIQNYEFLKSKLDFKFDLVFKSWFLKIRLNFSIS